MNEVGMNCNCRSALAVAAASMTARCVEPQEKILDMASAGFHLDGT